MPTKTITPTYEELWQRLTAIGIVSQTQLADLLSVGRAAVSWAKHKHIVPQSWIGRLLKRGFRHEWLLHGKGDAYTTKDNPVAVARELFYVPIISSRLVDGNTALLEDEEKIILERPVAESLSEGCALVATRVHGNSQAPILQDGDMALLDTNTKEIIPDKYYAVNMMNIIVMKKISITPKSFLLIQQNGDPIDVSPSDLMIIGRVVFITRRMN